MKKEIKFGKTVVLGDSYSTFEGVIPSNYPPCYGTFGRHGITSVDQTWWDILLAKTGDELLFNSSYSGSAIAEITYNGRYDNVSSFPARYKNDLDGLDYDTIFVLGGTNDAWALSPIGEPKCEGPYTADDLLCTVTSLCYLFSLIRKTHPDARIVNIVNNGYFKPEMIEGMERACEHFGADCIYLNDFSQDANHPDVKGMVQIVEKILAYYTKK